MKQTKLAFEIEDMYNSETKLQNLHWKKGITQQQQEKTYETWNNLKEMLAYKTGQNTSTGQRQTVGKGIWEQVDWIRNQVG